MFVPARARRCGWPLLVLLVACPVAGWANGPPMAPLPRPTAPPPAAPEPKPVAPPDAAPVPSSWTSYDDAVSESRRNDKPVLIDFNAEWCGPCRQLKAELFDDPRSWRAVQAAVIPVSIVDRQREEGSNPAETEMLQDRFEVRFFPTLIVYSPRTGLAATTRGYEGANQTLRWIREAARAVRPRRAARARR